ALAAQAAGLGRSPFGAGPLAAAATLTAGRAEQQYVHLLVRKVKNYLELGHGTYVVLASPRPLDVAAFQKALRRPGAARCQVLPIAALATCLAGRSRAVPLTDDYAPADNLLAPLFEERFRYRQR